MRYTFYCWAKKQQTEFIMEIMMKSAIDKKIEMVCKKYWDIPKVVRE